MKTDVGYRFGESIYKLIRGGNMGNTKITVMNLFVNKVVIKCNMFHTEWNTGLE